MSRERLRTKNLSKYCRHHRRVHVRGDCELAVNKNKKKTLERIQTRLDLTHRQINDLAELMASTFGPIVISSLIESGLKSLRQNRRKAKGK